jgi:hypothetical protein
MKDNWNYIKFNFSKFINTTQNNNLCRSEEINEYLIRGYLGIFIIDYSFEPTKYHNPYQPYVRNLYKSFSYKYFEDIFFLF